jgi:hypothetical protein
MISSSRSRAMKSVRPLATDVFDHREALGLLRQFERLAKGDSHAATLLDGREVEYAEWDHGTCAQVEQR